MTFQGLMYGDAMDIPALTGGRGALRGGTLNGISRYGDLENRISIGSAGAFMAKAMFREGFPYYRQFVNETLELLPVYHFLHELRRQLAGEIVDSRFSESEELLYTEYQEWIDGAVKVGETLLAVQTLDKWLVDEVMLVTHPELIREYTSTHKWMKLEERI